MPALENDPFPSGGGPHRGNLADFVYCLFFGLVVLTPLAWLLKLPAISFSLYYMVVYIWSKRHPAEPSSFYMFSVPAVMLPWVRGQGGGGQHLPTRVLPHCLTHLSTPCRSCSGSRSL